MVGGAAYYTGKKVQEGREEDAYRDARLDELEAQQMASAPPAPSGGGGLADGAIEQLQKLGELHEQGVLTDAEFEAQKQKVLGS
ncbi:MAG TPA: SHOCT domain-containing protein [Gaiellaceae bacterium]